jgi:hypothetical protein
VAPSHSLAATCIPTQLKIKVAVSTLHQAQWPSSRATYMKTLCLKIEVAVSALHQAQWPSSRATFMKTLCYIVGETMSQFMEAPSAPSQ